MANRPKAKCIRVAMPKKGINNKDLAKACGVSVTTVSGWRNKGCPDLRWLEKVAKACDMTLDELMKLAD